MSLYFIPTPCYSVQCKSTGIRSVHSLKASVCAADRPSSFYISGNMLTVTEKAQYAEPEGASR